jgi:hypothetical protein
MLYVDLSDKTRDYVQGVIRNSMRTVLGGGASAQVRRKYNPFFLLLLLLTLRFFEIEG